MKTLKPSVTGGSDSPERQDGVDSTVPRQLDPSAPGGGRRTRPTVPMGAEQGVTAPAEAGPAALLSREERTFIEERALGKGGMGVVRQVFDPRILRRTAMKRLDPERSHGNLQRRFVEEAQITGQLEHPNLVPIHEFGVDADGVLYMNMKLVEGRPLGEIVLEAGDERLSRDRLGDLIEVLMKVSNAVAYAHSRGVVHRDLKPSNVMVGEYGEVHVLDWGIARVLPGKDERSVRVSRSPEDQLDTANLVVGTPAWMAPEQASGEHDRIDPRTDVFGLGALLYFVLTGLGPYGEGEMLQLVYRAQAGKVVPISEIPGLPPVPPQLERVAARAMALDPADRYQTATQFRKELENFLRGTWSFPVRRFRAGEPILREGEAGNTAYVVASGRCEVFSEASGSRRVLREIGTGEAFGETAVFARSPRTASVAALTDVELIEVTEEALSEGLGLNSWMGTFVRALADRFREVDERLRRRQRGEAE